MESLVEFVTDVIWSPPLVLLCLGTGLYFSIRTRFVQVRKFAEMVRLVRYGKASSQGVSSFQAMVMSLSGRVGTGNIAGVATAITFGGPGAIFWMWVVAFFGASTAFAESTLSQIYKENREGQYRGGPAYYIEKGLQTRWYAIAFAIVTIIACGVLLPGVQANSIASAFCNSFSIAMPVTGAALVVLLGLVIFGGVKRIARAAELIVPFMAFGYILIACAVIALNIDKLPIVVSLIFTSAFGLDASFGTVTGLAVQWGVKRGIYSNEAGQGTGPHASAAAEVEHPAQQGLVQAFSVYIDTLFVCSATAFMILITGAYNVVAPAGRSIYRGVAGIEAGPGYTQHAIETILPGFGAAFVGIALFFFAFTTLIACYYIAETNVAYLSRKFGSATSTLVLRIVILAATLYGAVQNASIAWALGDIGVGLMAWLNILAIILLQKPALKTLWDYERQKRDGKALTFVPKTMDVVNATFWEDRVAKPFYSAHIHDEATHDATRR